MKKIVVLASGRGSNFEAILKAIEAKKLRAEISGLVCDRAHAPVLEIAKKWGIPSSVVLSEAKSGQRASHEQEMLNAVQNHGYDFVVLAGYRKILSPFFVNACSSQDSEPTFSRILNVHPSLLPAFVGLNGYAQAFQYGVKVTGVTVHLVNQELDAGPICAQESFDISDCQSIEEVEKKGLSVEHRLYPQTIDWILNQPWKLQDRGKRSYVLPC